MAGKAQEGDSKADRSLLAIHAVLNVEHAPETEENTTTNHDG